MGGVEELIWTEPGNVLRLPHASGASGTYKIYINNDGSKITLKFDKSG